MSENLVGCMLMPPVLLSGDGPPTQRDELAAWVPHLILNKINISGGPLLQM